MEYDPIKDKLGHIFKSPLSRKLFYNLLDLLLLRAWHVHKSLKEWFNKYPSGAKILDAGCGFGQYSYYIAKRNPNYDITAVDVKEDYLADCKQFLNDINIKNVHFLVDDLVTYQSPNTYDLIISVDVMEHILEDVEVFKNFHASLKSGAMLIINTPSDQGGSDVKEEGQESFIGEHVRDGYNIEDITAKLNSVGFNKVDARYTYGSPGKISWKLSMKYPMTLLNISFLFILILPFYYLITYPFAFVLNYFDINGRHKTGTGLNVRAWKD
jgi:2-polyprenyl-3-methyl-5-hydroxy-6-metoxy-1,4-benzoquinol methylase